MVGLIVPQLTYRHAYVVTEPIPGIKKTPNVRDHDGSVYLKRQGDSLQIGGYEPNPILCEKVKNFEEHSTHFVCECSAALRPAYFEGQHACAPWQPLVHGKNETVNVG